MKVIKRFLVNKLKVSAFIIDLNKSISKVRNNSLVSFL